MEQIRHEFKAPYLVALFSSVSRALAIVKSVFFPLTGLVLKYSEFLVKVILLVV